MKIELSAELSVWVQEHAPLHGFASAEAFVEKVLSLARDRLLKTMEQTLLDSIASGDPIEATPEFWEERKRVLAERMQRRGKAAS